METNIYKLDNKIFVEAKLEPRKGLEGKVRFYPQEAFELAKSFSDLEIEVTEETSLIITNYVEPFQGVWSFKLKIQPDESFIKMADEHFDNEIIKSKKSKKNKESI